MIKKETNQTPSSIHFIALGTGASKALCYVYNQKLNAEYTCIGDVSSITIPEGINVIPFVSPKDFFDDESYEWRYPKIKISEWCYSKIKIPEDILNLFNSQKDNICSYPFSFEGRKRTIMAIDFTKKMQEASNFIKFNLDDLRNKYGNMTLKKALNKANEEFFKEIKELIKLKEMEYVYNKDSVLKWMNQNRKELNKLKNKIKKRKIDRLVMLTLELKYQYLESIYKKDENSFYIRGIFPSSP